MSKIYDVVLYICEVVFDEVKMVVYIMGNVIVGCWYFWLKDCKINLVFKNKLVFIFFKGGILFGGEVCKVIKKCGNKY